MSTDGNPQTATTATPAAASGSLLDQITKMMPVSVEKPRGDALIESLVDQSLKGTVKFDRTITNTIKLAMESLDKAISKQLAAVMHAPAFQKLEGSWRGLNYLVMNSETGSGLKIRVIHAEQKELLKDFEKAVEFDQSTIFKKTYSEEFGTPGGEPYSTLICDYQFTNHPDDIELLVRLSQVAAAGFAPVLTAADAKMMGLENYEDLTKPRDLEKVFLDDSYVKWRGFRDSEDSRFVVLTMPRTLSRLPYGVKTKPIEEFDFEEVDLDAHGDPKPVPSEQFAWMNTAYVLGTKLTDAYAKTGWCTAIRGAENGGKVEGLPAFIFKSDDGDNNLKCPTEIAITDRREAELSKCGFLPLCFYKHTDYAVFFGGQTCQKPVKYDRPDPTANAAISARLPYMLATSRIAHYLKVIARDKVGSFKERQNMEDFMARWIANYVVTDPTPQEAVKARYPLAAAQVKVDEVPGAPGSYNAVVWMRPWLQMEELTTSLRMVAKIPKLPG